MRFHIDFFFEYQTLLMKALIKIIIDARSVKSQKRIEN